MKVKYVEVELAKTVQPVKFDALRIGYKVGVTLDDNEEANDKLNEIRAHLRKKIDAAIKEEIEMGWM